MSKTKKRKLLMANERLRKELDIARADYKEMQIAYEETNKRLRLAGSMVETIDGPTGKIQIIKAEAKAWGNYVIGYEINAIEEYKERLIRDIAAGLAESNVVQFIVKGANDFYPLDQYMTVGAKLYVVPWEELRTGNTIKLMREVMPE